jgi:hypothetical protein
MGGIGNLPGMKATFFSLLLFISLLVPAQALDLVTPSGTFKDVKVTKVEAEALRITHSEGTALVDFDELPPAMQAEYGWTPEKSAARKAAKEAEAKRIEEEERMIEDAPKRKAAEEAAKKRAEMESQEAAERAMRNAEEAKRRAEEPDEAKDLLAEAAKARAEIDRERNKGKQKPGVVPAEASESSLPATVIDAPAPKNNVVVPPFGTVSSLLERDNPWTKNKNLWIGVGVGAAIVFLLFLLPSGSKKKVPRR